MPIIFSPSRDVDRAQQVRNSMTGLAESLMNLGKVKRENEQRKLFDNLVTSLGNEATTPVQPELPIQDQPGLEQPTPVMLSPYEQNKAVRENAYNKILQSGMAPEKQEQLFKLIDKRFPEIKPQELEYTDIQTGRPLKVKEGTPEFRAVVSNPERFQRGGASEIKPSKNKYTNTRTGRTVEVMAGSKEEEQVKSNPLYEAGGESEIKKDKLTQLIEKHDSLPDADRNKPLYKRAIEKEVAQRGQTISIDKDGNISITEGPLGAGGGLTKPTVNKVQEKLLNSSESLARLNEIEAQSFSPDGQLKKEFLTFPGKLKGFMSNMKDLANVDLAPEEQKFLGDLTQFRVASFNNLNKTLNELSGAAVTEHETKRLTQELPNPGTGPFSGDGPTVFASKLKQSLKTQKMAIARLNYVQKNGFEVKKNKEGKVTGMFDDNGNQIQIDDMPEKIDATGEKILAQIKKDNPGIPEKQARSLALQRVKQIFFSGN